MDELFQMIFSSRKYCLSRFIPVIHVISINKFYYSLFNHVYMW
jgi:hypothetical protein